MFNYQDQKQIKNIIKEEIPDIVKKELIPLDNKIDQILQIVTRIDQEHALTQTKVIHHDKHLRKIESKLKLKSPSSTSVFA